MIAARARVLLGNNQAEAATVAEVSRSRVAQADVVIRYAPELVDAVSAGGSLNQAYDIARGRKREEGVQQRKMFALRADWPEFGASLHRLKSRWRLRLRPARRGVASELSPKKRWTRLLRAFV